MTFWPAPSLKSGAVVDARVQIPASKSLTNRYLILAALSERPTVIHNPLRARDTYLMVQALRALGTHITQQPLQESSQSTNSLASTVYPPANKAECITLSEGRITGFELAPDTQAAPHQPLTHTLDTKNTVTTEAKIAKESETTGEQTQVSGNESWYIYPKDLHGARIAAGLAGTVMRFIPPLAALAQGETILDGDLQARKRPMQTTISSLQALGVEISGSHLLGSACLAGDQLKTDASNKPCTKSPLAEGDSSSASLPIKISGTGSVSGGEIEIDASASSQFVSALLLAGARFDSGLTLHHHGDQLPSLPHIEMTLATLRECGVKATASHTTNAATWRVPPGEIQLPETTVESDLSNAGPFLAAAMITKGTILIPHWPNVTTQAGAHFVEIFRQQGARVSLASDDGILSEGTLKLSGPATIAPLDMDCHAIGELVPTLAAVCAFASGPSALRNIGQLRGHETDRLAAITTELEKVGVAAKIDGDDLLIAPPSSSAKYRAAKLSSYADHRMATFGAILGLRIPGVEIEDIETTSKTMPNFVELWEDMLRQSQLLAADEPAQDTPQFREMKQRALPKQPKQVDSE